MSDATNPAIRCYLTASQVAERLVVDIHAILGWISRGELRAVNVASDPNGRRPRWRIDPADLAVFEARRAAVPPVTVRRRRQQEGIIKFF
jgi:hypothetical protein